MGNNFNYKFSNNNNNYNNKSNNNNKSTYHSESVRKRKRSAGGPSSEEKSNFHHQEVDSDAKSGKLIKTVDVKEGGRTPFGNRFGNQCIDSRNDCNVYRLANAANAYKKCIVM